MQTTFQSSIAQTEVLQASMMRSQREIAIASEEASTGRHSDEGLALGRETRDLLLGRQFLSQLDTTQKSNAIVGARLTSIQSVLAAVRGLAEGFADALIAAKQGVNRELIAEDAKGRLQSLTTLLSTAVDGVYLFGGLNVSQDPVRHKSGLIGAALAGDSFQSAFGFEISDQASATLTSSDMDRYMAGPYDIIFADPSWKAHFSTATDLGIATSIDMDDVVESTQSINTEDIRKLFKALTAVILVEKANLKNDVTDKVISTSLEWSVSAAVGITNKQGLIGLSQQQLIAVEKHISWKQEFLERQVAGKQSVDQAEVATKLNLLAVQLQASFALTAKIQKLSLLDYI